MIGGRSSEQRRGDEGGVVGRAAIGEQRFGRSRDGARGRCIG